MVADYSLRPARADDAPAVAALVDAAYQHYVPRIGGRPGPMEADYNEVIATRAVTLAESATALAGIVVLAETPDGFLVENVAVHPDHQHRGLGRTLLAFAESEASRAGYDSMYLYTHELMIENLALYVRLGYVEYARPDEGQHSRVFLRKLLER